MPKTRANPTLQVLCVAGIVAVLITAIVGSRTSTAQAEERTSGLARACSSSGAVNAARLPARVALEDCDLVGRTVVSGQLGATVPTPGRGVHAAALQETGESELSITTSPSGVVTISGGEAFEAADSEAAAALLGPPAPEEPCDKYNIDGCLPPCDANSAAVNSSRARVKRGQPWKFKAGSTPTSMFSAAEALAEIKAGTKNVINVNNDCGMNDNVNKTSFYKGTTTVGTGITVQGGSNVCGNPNEKNVVDFGQLQPPTIGLACTFTQRIGTNPWFIIEADIRFRAASPWTLTPDSKDCSPSNSYDLRGVVTHERAHAFGVGHASIANDPANSQLTMYPTTYPCSGYARTFGRGDVRALNILYN